MDLWFSKAKNIWIILSEKLAKIWNCRKFYISYSPVCRVIWNCEGFPTFNFSLFKTHNFKLHWWRRAKEKKTEYIQKQSEVFSSANVLQYIMTEIGMKVDKKSIISFLNDTLELSYKRIYSRPTKSNNLQTKMKKIIFWLEFANLLNGSHIIVNIDETLFSRSNKINYS